MLIIYESIYFSFSPIFQCAICLSLQKHYCGAIVRSLYSSRCFFIWMLFLLLNFCVVFLSDILPNKCMHGVLYVESVVQYICVYYYYQCTFSANQIDTYLSLLMWKRYLSHRQTGKAQVSLRSLARAFTVRSREKASDQEPYLWPLLSDWAYMSHVTTKRVFGSFRPGQTQTGLRSHRS